MTDYNALNEMLQSLSEGVAHPITIFSNASALLYQELEEINWAGDFCPHIGEDNLK